MRAKRAGVAGLVPAAGLLALTWITACGAGDDRAGDTEGSEGRAAATAAQDTGREARPSGGVRRMGGSLVREIRVGGVAVSAEMAETPETRERGLMYRDTLPENHGMLFVYPEERNLSFWMRNTQIPLDIAFINGAGTIVDIQQMAPMSDTTHVSRRPAMYALEMRKGWFEDHGVEVGDRVEF